MNTRIMFAKIMVGCFIASVGLLMMQVLRLGSKHAQTIADGDRLLIENTELREQMDSLNHATVVVSTQQTLVQDSVTNPSDEVLPDHEHEMKIIKQQLDHEKRNSVTSPYNTSPYDFGSAEVSGAEDN